MNISEKLKKLRLDNGLTQTQLAQKLNIGQTTIAAYENGTHDPQIFSLIAYADFFNCSLDYLVGRENDLGVITVIHDEIISNDEKQLLYVYGLLCPSFKKLLNETALLMVKSDINKK